MTAEINKVKAVEHKVIEIGGDVVVAEIDARGELVKTWPAPNPDRSREVIKAHEVLIDPKAGK